MEEWKQQIINTGKDVVEIKTKVEGIEKTMDWRFKDHEGRIRTVEGAKNFHNGEAVAEEKFLKRHRGKIGLGIGSVSVGTALTVFCIVLKIVGVIG